MKKNLYLGIDIGGTYIRMVALRGLKLQRPAMLKVPSWHSVSKLETGLRRYITNFLGNQQKYLAGVGVSIAGVVDNRRGVLVRAHNIEKINGWNAKAFFSYLNAPIRIENDARCFLLSELKWGRGRGKKNAVGIAIGTGIGGAVFTDGKMYRGGHHSAGELGFMILRDEPPKFFEDLAGKAAHEKFGNRSKVRGLGVASVINAFDPEIVIIGGGAAEAKDFNLTTIVKTARAHITNPLAKKTPIVKSTLGESAQAIGAALLFAK